MILTAIHIVHGEAPQKKLLLEKFEISFWKPNLLRQSDPQARAGSREVSNAEIIMQAANCKCARIK